MNDHYFLIGVYNNYYRYSLVYPINMMTQVTVYILYGQATGVLLYTGYGRMITNLPVNGIVPICFRNEGSV